MFAGVIPPPPKALRADGEPAVDVTVVPTIIEATLEDVEDGSVNSETDLQVINEQSCSE